MSQTQEATTTVNTAVEVDTKIIKDLSTDQPVKGLIAKTTSLQT
jgi:hypothetical protein